MNRKIELIQNENQFTLKRNGALLVCPYKNRVLTPGQSLAGQTFNITDMPCSSSCPMFEVLDNGNIYLNCSKTDIFITKVAPLNKTT